jgi:L-fucose mutarotase/ribose pyranase (RbsD/FucU family)
MLWKSIVSLSVLLTLIVSVFVIDSRYATNDKIVEAREKIKETNDKIKDVEKRTIDIMEDFRKEQARVLQLARYYHYSEMYVRYKLMLHNHPNDDSIKETLEEIAKERDRIQTLIQ